MRRGHGTTAPLQVPPTIPKPAKDPAATPISDTRRIEETMDAVFFDIDDTIYDQAQPFANAVHKVLGPVPGATDGDLYVASRRHSGEVFAAFGRGERPSEDVYIRRMQATMADFGLTITREQALRMQTIYVSRDEGAMSLSPAMAQTLDWCARHALRGIGAISNGRQDRQLDKLHQLGCSQWIPDERVFVSEALEMAKPGPQIFRHACEQLGTTPRRSLYVGDAYAIDVVGARAAGMPVAWFNRRQHPVPAGPDDVRATWVVNTDEELLALVKRVV